jgi:hypothetical protein
MHNYSRKRWVPDPTLPPDETAVENDQQRLGALAAFRGWYRLQNLGVLRFIRVWYGDIGHVRREVRKIMSGERPLPRDFPEISKD